MSRREPTYDPAELVPEGYRTTRLPVREREWVERTTDDLAGAFDLAYGDSDEDINYPDTEAEMLTDDRIQWWGSESERTVASLGRTFEGRFINPDRHGVVIKFNPWLRAEEGSRLGSFSASGNVHELAMWRYVVEAGDAALFGTVLDYADDGAWLAMREYLPVYRHKAPRHQGSPDYVAERHLGAADVDDFNRELLDAGYDAHLKDGNIALDLAAKSLVVVDYGAHVSLTADDDHLDDHLEEW